MLSGGCRLPHSLVIRNRSNPPFDRRAGEVVLVEVPMTTSAGCYEQGGSKLEAGTSPRTRLSTYELRLLVEPQKDVVWAMHALPTRKSFARSSLCWSRSVLLARTEQSVQTFASRCAFTQ